MLVMWLRLVQIQWLIKQKNKQTNKRMMYFLHRLAAMGKTVNTQLTSDYRREGVLTGHRRCLAEAAGIQGVLSNQLSFLLICHAWRGQHLCSFLFIRRFILLVNNTKKTLNRLSTIIKISNTLYRHHFLFNIVMQCCDLELPVFLSRTFDLGEDGEQIAAVLPGREEASVAVLVS